MSSERQQSDVDDPWWGEHVHRYLEAATLVGPDATVLDIACGAGYGTAMLARSTRGLAIGCDRSWETVERAARVHGGSPAHFVCADATRVPLATASIDVVVSFETIEHLDEDRRFLAELGRVMRPDGVLVLSTPNRRVTSPDGHIVNPFHRREYTSAELRTLLAEVFPSIELRGQRYVRFAATNPRRGRVRFVERVLYQRGVRKLPLSMRNGLSRVVTGHPHYPRPADFALVGADAAEGCTTFVVVCRRQAPDSGHCVSGSR